MQVLDIRISSIEDRNKKNNTFLTFLNISDLYVLVWFMFQVSSKQIKLFHFLQCNTVVLSQFQYNQYT